uniref:Uncharacterized protein n=1 Tax=Avena sativa TaxID=4498 RepID=A0ACD5TR55_AVESA
MGSNPCTTIAASLPRFSGQIFRPVRRSLLPLSKSDDSCNEPIWNTTEKLHRQFRIDPVVNLNLIIYNCTNASAAARSEGELVETGMRCGDASEVFVGVEGKNEEASAVDGCVAVVLPVLGGADGEANASDYEHLISSGFVLTWENPARKLVHPSKSCFKTKLISRYGRVAVWVIRRSLTSSGTD